MPAVADVWDLHNTAANQAHDTLNRLCQVTTDESFQDGNRIVHADFHFDDTAGTRLADTVDDLQKTTWNGGITDTSTVNGCLRIRRNKTAMVNRYVDISPDVRVKAEGAPKSHRGWIVVDIAGWNLHGMTENEEVRIGFTSRPDQDLHVAGLRIRRTGRDEVTVDGVAFGQGSQPIESTQRWPAQQQQAVTFVIELDKVAGNNGEGDAGGRYRLFAKRATDKSFKPIGNPATVRRLRNGNHMHLHASGFFAAREEYFDIDRIHYTTTDPTN